MDFLNNLLNTIFSLHPIHAMVVHFPIALSGVAFLSILIAWWKKSQLFEKAAFFDQFLTAISVIFAAATGILDNINRWQDSAPNHELKVVLGIIMFLLSAGIVYLRWRNKDLFDRKGIKGWYIATYGVIFLLSLILGFLGGVIVYGFSGSTQASNTPTPSSTTQTVTMSFAQDILPVFEGNCTSCHNSSVANGGVALDSYTNVMSSNVISAGSANSSRLVREVQSGRMPPNGKLSATDIQKIVDWIDQGALDN